jgi:hypothetical protein
VRQISVKKDPGKPISTVAIVTLDSTKPDVTRWSIEPPPAPDKDHVEMADDDDQMAEAVEKAEKMSAAQRHHEDVLQTFDGDHTLVLTSAEIAGRMGSVVDPKTLSNWLSEMTSPRQKLLLNLGSGRGSKYQLAPLG